MQFSDFKKFDVKTLPKNFSGLIVGKRRTGKTVILKDLLYQVKGNYKKAYIFTETLTLQDIYGFIPPENRFPKFNEEVIQGLWDEQQNYIEREMAKNPKVDKSKLDHILIIMDDVIADSKIRSSEIINRIAVQARHLNIACVILSQTISGKYGINLVCRSNVDFIISFFPQAEYEKDLIVSQYLSIDNKKIGTEILKLLTNKDYHAIVIELYKTDQDYREFVKWYVAKTDIPDFVIGERSSNISVSQPVRKMKSLKTSYTIKDESGNVIKLSSC